MNVSRRNLLKGVIAGAMIGPSVVFGAPPELNRSVIIGLGDLGRRLVRTFASRSPHQACFVTSDRFEEENVSIDGARTAVPIIAVSPAHEEWVARPAPLALLSSRPLDNSMRIVVAAGLGGRGGAEVFAGWVSRRGDGIAAPVVGVFALPFAFEGARRKAALEQLDRFVAELGDCVTVDLEHCQQAASPGEFAVAFLARMDRMMLDHLAAVVSRPVNVFLA